MPHATPPSRLADLRALARDQSGVVSRIQAYGLEVSRSEIRAHVRGSRWRRLGTQSIAVHTGPLCESARMWAAVFEAGPRAQLDGVSALVASGLTGFRPDRIRVSVPRGARVRRARGLDIRQTRRWDGADLVTSGIPRTRPAVAAVRAALWAASDRQATLLLTMAVQQRLVTAEALGEAALRVRRDRRRRLLHNVILDLVGGALSLGEQEFARECRLRGLPEPTRQVLRSGRGGRYYLDVAWEEWGVVVEIDGIHHGWASQQVEDALRQNDLVLQGGIVLRLPLLGLRASPDTFFAQILEALRRAGWPG